MANHSIRKSASAPAHRARRKPHFFRPVPTRSRKDGWDEVRQCLFLAELYFTGIVTTAARRVGMSRESAYRLRARPEAASFARAWDSVLASPGTGKLPALRADGRKVTQRQLIEWVETGFVKPVLYYGKVAAIRRKPDNFALLRLARRFAEGSKGRPSSAPETGLKSFAKPPDQRSKSQENAMC